ncbi:hypothetical protein P9112_013975 [Eukaryota sp. TZLM1-RC]
MTLSLTIPTHSPDGSTMPASPRAISCRNREHEIVSKLNLEQDLQRKRSLNSPKQKEQREREIVASQAQRIAQNEKALAVKAEMLKTSKQILESNQFDDVINKTYSPKAKSSPKISTSPGPFVGATTLQSPHRREYDDETRAQLTREAAEYNRSVIIEKDQRHS